MRVTEQQVLVLFDIVKWTLGNGTDNIAGYTRDDVGRLLNDVISQQDNSVFVDYVVGNDVVSGGNGYGDGVVVQELEDSFWDE